MHVSRSYNGFYEDLFNTLLSRYTVINCAILLSIVPLHSVMASYCPDRAAKLVLESDSDESLLDNESCSDSYSSSEEVDQMSQPHCWLRHVAVEGPRQGPETAMFGINSTSKDVELI